MFDAIQFCNDFNIDYSKRGKYFRKGWTNVHCPFCKGSKHTLGICHRNGMTTCYKCGGKYINNVIWELTRKKPIEILKKYNNGDLVEQEIQMSTTCNMPDCTSLTPNHSKYLKSRNYDPYELIYDYGILSAKKHTDYSGRVIIPIFYKGRIVSFQGRDATGTSELRYKACKEKDEVLKHKRTLYNIDKCGDRILVVEGVFDVWRIGANCVSTFGISYTPYQVDLLSNFKQVFILFDNEIQAQDQADKLYYDLKFLGVDSEVIELDGDFDDPGEMKSEDVKYLKKYLDI